MTVRTIAIVVAVAALAGAGALVWHGRSHQQVAASVQNNTPGDVGRAGSASAPSGTSQNRQLTDQERLQGNAPGGASAAPSGAAQKRQLTDEEQREVLQAFQAAQASGKDPMELKEEIHRRLAGAEIPPPPVFDPQHPPAPNFSPEQKAQALERLKQLQQQYNLPQTN